MSERIYPLITPDRTRIVDDPATSSMAALILYAQIALGRWRRQKLILISFFEVRVDALITQARMMQVTVSRESAAAYDSQSKTPRHVKLIVSLRRGGKWGPEVRDKTAISTPLLDHGRSIEPSY